jgi:hypothetical protein
MKPKRSMNLPNLFEENVKTSLTEVLKGQFNHLIRVLG